MRTAIALATLACLSSLPAAAQGYYGRAPAGIYAGDYVDDGYAAQPYPGRVYTTAPSLDQPSVPAYSGVARSEGYARVAMPDRRPRAAVPYYDPYGDFDEYGQATGRNVGRDYGYGGADAPAASPIPREMVSFDPSYAPGTIVVRSAERRLYYVTARGEAISYGVGVGRPGFGWKGVQTVSAKREWPDWIPPAEMLKRRPDLPRRMAGGIENPLGARAIYLGSSLYRIHGSNEPESIGTAVSSAASA